jgi:hypothetical protein
MVYDSFNYVALIAYWLMFRRLGREWAAGSLTVLVGFIKI